MASEPDTTTPISGETSLALLIGRERLAAVIAAFHARVRAESALSSFFASMDGHEEHQAIVTEFWWRLLGGGAGDTSIRPADMIAGHAGLRIEQRDLDAWLSIFASVLSEYLPRELSEAWFRIAKNLGRKMTSRGLVKAAEPADR